MKLVGIIAAAGLLALAGCASNGSATGASEAAVVRLGYFPNVTHATALVALNRGTFAAELGPRTKLESRSFNAGPAAVEALFSGALDVSYVGPNPAINAYVQSHGEAVRVIAGATSGGAALVVRTGITSAPALRGAKLASPQLGGTQDIALRYWLNSQGLKTTTEGGGDVAILPQDNATALQAFRQGAIDGAWVPEPWASRMVLEGGGHVMVDERNLWPGGHFVTAVLLARTDFLRAHPAQVAAILRAHVKTQDFIHQHPDDARAAANAQLLAVTGKGLSEAVLTRSFADLEFTNDPLATTFAKDIEHAEQLGLLKTTDIGGLFDLAPLNQVLSAAGEPAVRA